MFYSSPTNVIMPGLARNQAEGWETARRRDEGNDWFVLRQYLLRHFCHRVRRCGYPSVQRTDALDALLDALLQVKELEWVFRLQPGENLL